MASPLVPARLEFRDGSPWSEAYGDVYHSADGGPGQARHVFLGGNGLPDRWQERERFVILETGFGAGLNFLVAWRAWRADPQRCQRLHFVSIEKHPFSRSDLAALHERHPELAGEAAALHAAWPPLVPGLHRLSFDEGRVVLDLFFADAARLRELELAADAFFLDGFSPARNPEMWSPALLRTLSRLAAPGATAATWTVAGAVREALTATGFGVERRAGFGHKREMLVARLIRPSGREGRRVPERKVLVVGAGLAGAAASERLCARGWEVELLERRPGPAMEASGNLAGSFHPVMTPDDSVFARVTRAGFLAQRALLARLSGVRWDPCGLLQLARTDKELGSQRASIAALGAPPEYAQFATQEEASAHAGVPVSGAGLWFPEAGWIQPPSLVRALLEACGPRLRVRYGVEVSDIAAVAEGRPVVLACAREAARLAEIPALRLRQVRGQVTHVPADRLEPPRAAVLRGGFILPPVDGQCVVGASFDLDDEDPGVRESSHAGNLERLAGILPDSNLAPGQRPWEGRTGFRAVAPDRLPVVGPLEGTAVHLLTALGSRGLTWVALAAELLASGLEGEPLPIEAPLAAALAPGRFSRRAAARRAAPRAGPP